MDCIAQSGKGALRFLPAMMISRLAVLFVILACTAAFTPGKNSRPLLNSKPPSPTPVPTPAPSTVKTKFSFPVGKQKLTTAKTTATTTETKKLSGPSSQFKDDVTKFSVPNINTDFSKISVPSVKVTLPTVSIPSILSVKFPPISLPANFTASLSSISIPSNLGKLSNIFAAPPKKEEVIVAPPVVVKPKFDKEIGAQWPLGFWDPLGFLKDADQERFDRLRTVEIKHGRISMLAIVGHIVTTKGGRLSGDIVFGTKFSDIDNGLAALFGPHSIPWEAKVPLLIFIGAIDLAFTNYAKPDVEKSCIETMESLKWSKRKQRNKAAIELNNGRAAQMGILGLMVHEKLDNDPYIINTLLGAPVPFNIH